MRNGFFTAVWKANNLIKLDDSTEKLRKKGNLQTYLYKSIKQTKIIFQIN